MINDVIFRKTALGTMAALGGGLAQTPVGEGRASKRSERGGEKLVVAEGNGGVRRICIAFGHSVPARAPGLSSGTLRRLEEGGFYR